MAVSGVDAHTTVANLSKESQLCLYYVGYFGISFYHFFAEREYRRTRPK